ncbi:KH domain-containing protein [Paenibacillus sp. N4]|uniref:KH domain-containing protein n=1 Tax=Paenibacillus vietnamensis TaxID=2590547 RepID=UPI001CD15C92|nr:KH domain-containing protein [Paenibacillus vietnamensis]MCA0754009.1 KH domain-containing protein [Paenibacillus vietnamensis]
MKELILVIARALVDHPDQVQVQVKDDDRSTIYELSVHPEDIGKIIGKQGRIAKAMRTVVTSASVKSSKRVIVDIMS